MEEKILTLHPDGKQGVNISKAKYDLMRQHFIEILEIDSNLGFNQIVDQLDKRLAGQFDGSIPWYSVVVKQDLEARKLIERHGKKSSPLYKLNK